MSSVLPIEIAEGFLPLIAPARYKGAHGGRGSGKSHFFAEQVVIRCYAAPTRVVCIREVQNSLKESVKQLIADKIAALGLSHAFTILESEIRGPRGSLIIFRGMQAYNATNIKSLEGYDIAWVEEAQDLSAISLRMLRPTIRKPGSELWFSWNPRFESDAINEFLRGPHRPDDAVVVEVNWNHNPWFPAELKSEMRRDVEADPEMADHVWNGGYQIVSEGSYYAKLIAQAEREGRIGSFGYDPAAGKVMTSWDIGVFDFTAIWFFQRNHMWVTAIDYYEARNEGAEDVISIALPEVFVPPQRDERFGGWSKANSLQVLNRTVPFEFGDHYFPHDIGVREWGAGARSRIETVTALGMRNVRRGGAAHPEDRVAAVRRMLPVTRFADTPRVRLGLNRLRHYVRRRNDALGTYLGPLHDENSHGADAFGEFAVNCPLAAPPVIKTVPKVSVRQPTLNEVLKDHDRRSRSSGGRI